VQLHLCPNLCCQRHLRIGLRHLQNSLRHLWNSLHHLQVSLCRLQIRLRLHCLPCHHHAPHFSKDGYFAKNAQKDMIQCTTTAGSATHEAEDEDTKILYE
jgi:hypothetical protein